MIYTFYSFKGGVGRTLSLAHSAIRIAQTRHEKKYRILVVDMDLEAPGLDIYLPTETGKARLGISGLIGHYIKNGQSAKWLEENIENEQYMSKVPNTENLWIIPSGIKSQLSGNTGEGHSYIEVISNLKYLMPKQKSPARPKEGFFSDFAKLLNERFTYIFIDARSGLAEQAYASTLLLADVFVPCFRLNRANIEGIQTVLGNFLLRDAKRLGDPNLPIIPIASPVPPRAGSDIEKWMSLAKKVFYGKENTNSDLSNILRIFAEPSLEIGETIVFNFDGSLKEGYSEQTPVVGCINELVTKIVSFNCDKDALAAKAVEMKHYRKREYDKAIDYLFKRIRLEPFDDKHWLDLLDGYGENKDCRAKVKEFLSDLIGLWRKDLDRDDACRKRLAHALLTWVICFGNDLLDAGLMDIDECLSLSLGDSSLEEDVHYRYGRVIDEIVKNRRSENLVYMEDYSRKINLELANEHYTKAIEIGLKRNKRGGNALCYRARNFKALNKPREALLDFDKRLLELADAEDEGSSHSRILILREQGLILEALGYHNLALQNYLVSYKEKPTDTDTVRAIFGISRRLELKEYEKEIIKILGELEPNNAGLHRLIAITYILWGNLTSAREEIEKADYYSTETSLDILKVFFHFASGSIEQAFKTIKNVLEIQDDKYNRAFYAIIAALLNKKIKDEYIESNSLSDWHIICIAAISNFKIDLAKKILEKVTPESMIEKAILLALKDTCNVLNLEEDIGSLNELKKLFQKHPLLPIVFRNDAENLLFRKVCDFLKNRKELKLNQKERIATLWDIVDCVKASNLSDFNPRDVSKTLPINQLIIDEKLVIS